jgi:uncharacterized phage infection (PIP) family protein YhgE
MTEQLTRRWVTAWVTIGLVIVAVTAVFLVLISNALVRIDGDLATTDRAVTDVNGHTRTLPDQIARVNTSLAAIDTALHALPTDTVAISNNLDRITTALRQIRADLGSTAPTLAGTADNLVISANQMAPISAGLRDTSGLLDRLIAATAGMDRTMVSIVGSRDTGLGGLHRNLTLVSQILHELSGDLGDITGLSGGINTHLEHICRSAAVSVLHGPQPC